MRLAITISALGLVLAGCAVSAATYQSGQSSQERADRELADALKGRVAGAPQSCISALMGTDSQIVDSRTVLYRQGAKLWRNDLEGGCPGLNSSDTLIIDTHGSQFCRLDTIRVRELGSAVAERSCRLGKFTPYTKMK